MLGRGQLNNMVWEKVITHNAKKKRSPRKTDPKAPKRAKVVKATSSTPSQEVYTVELTSMMGAMLSFMNSNGGAGSFMADAGIAYMTTNWTVAQNNHSFGGHYVVTVADAHKFLHACIKWGLDPRQQQTT